MRGTPEQADSWQHEYGIIPAHAGNTTTPSRRCSRSWDHPRACGEHLGHALNDRCQPGSSPRMRGTLYRSLSCVDRAGIIPAHAGNTGGLTRGGCFASGSSPRMRGTLQFITLTVFTLGGSSPRMRGTLANVACGYVAIGIIPAHAGNTMPTLRTTGQDRDHPRACGEHLASLRISSPGSGSSPRMRGTLIP